MNNEAHTLTQHHLSRDLSKNNASYNLYTQYFGRKPTGPSWTNHRQKDNSGYWDKSYISSHSEAYGMQGCMFRVATYYEQGL